jgi:hypothetical protein
VLGPLRLRAAPDLRFLFTTCKVAGSVFSR